MLPTYLPMFLSSLFPLAPLHPSDCFDASALGRLNLRRLATTFCRAERPKTKMPATGEEKEFSPGAKATPRWTSTDCCLKSGFGSFSIERPCGRAGYDSHSTSEPECSSNILFRLPTPRDFSALARRPGRIFRGTNVVTGLYFHSQTLKVQRIPSQTPRMRGRPPRMRERPLE